MRSTLRFTYRAISYPGRLARAAFTSGAFHQQKSTSTPATTASETTASPAPELAIPSESSEDRIALPASVHSITSTQNHHDLPSFRAYASRANLPATSSVYVGTHYEYRVRSSLSRLGMRLARVGGRSDAGIDLQGHWILPTQPSTIEQEPLKLLVQCKAQSRAGPHLIRELEGAFASAPAGWSKNAIVGLLVVQRHATAGIREAMGRSRLPLAYAMIEKDGRIVQLLWNRTARDTGLDQLGVTSKYVVGSITSGGTDHGQYGHSQQPMQQEVALTWKGEILPSHPIAFQ